jgi:hypothetical protein
MTLAERIQKVRRRKLVMATLLRWLSCAGVRVVPYGLYVESNDYLDQATLMERFKQRCEVKVLEPCTIDRVTSTEKDLKLKGKFTDLWNQGCVCICAMSDNRLLGYCWFHMERCVYDYLSFDLEPDEGYAFNFWTAKHARWVTPLLGNAVHAWMRSMGKERIYSITESFNSPALALRRKLRSRLYRSYVYIGLSGKNIKLS